MSPFSRKKKDAHADQDAPADARDGNHKMAAQPSKDGKDNDSSVARDAKHVRNDKYFWDQGERRWKKKKWERSRKDDTIGGWRGTMFYLASCFLVAGGSH